MSRNAASRSLRTTLLVLAIGLAIGYFSSPKHQPPTQAPSAPSGGVGKLAWSVYFSPDGGATEAVVTAIDTAKQKILVQAYSFTSVPIAKALVEAKRRGVAVQILLDDSNESSKYSSADFLLRAGIPTYIDSSHAIAHNKVMVIDDATVITGSFNFTKAAEQSNAENLLIIRDPALVARYTENWQTHRDHSDPFGRK